MNDSDWTSEFYNLYFNSDPNKRNRGYSLLKQNRPDKFCKYMGNVNYIIKFLDYQSHHSVSPDLFKEKSDGRWYKFSSDAREYNPGERKILNFFIESLVHSDNNHNHENNSDILREVLKVCSFTTNPLSQKMWEDYANSSEGICVEYDINKKTYSKATNIHNFLFPMIYTEKPCDLSEFVLSGDNTGWNGKFINYLGVLKTLLKSSEYKDEKEWRSITYNPLYSGRANHAIPTSIYLGKNVSESTKEKVLQIAEKKYISVYQVIENEENIEYYSIFEPKIYF